LISGEVMVYSYHCNECVLIVNLVIG